MTKTFPILSTKYLKDNKEMNKVLSPSYTNWIGEPDALREKSEAIWRKKLINKWHLGYISHYLTLNSKVKIGGRMMDKTQKQRILGCLPAKKIEKTEKEIALGQRSKME